MLVDGAVIRKKIKKDYEKALRDLDKSRRQVDQFQHTDLPEFTRWLNANFGTLLTELREVSQKLAANEALVFLVQNEVMFGANSYARAYQRVMQVQENPEPPATESDDPAGRQRDPLGARPEAGGEDGEGDPLGAFFDEIFGEFGPGKSRHDPQAAPVDGTARLKELYRALARRLHPDSQREMTAQKTEWWHQAQAAYEAHDTEQLEVILTLCEIGDSGTTAHTSASRLQRITAQLKTSLRELKRQLAGKRKDPAWSFSLRTDHEVLAVQMRRALRGELQGLREHWQRTQELIATWKTAAERLKPARCRKHTR